MSDDRTDLEVLDSILQNIRGKKAQAGDPRSLSMKIKMAEEFEEYEADYRNDDHFGEVVHEDDEVVIVADASGHQLNDIAERYGVDRTAISEFFHRVARNRCDYSWEVSDPVVFDKFED
jgi:hypothetical protein